MPGPGLDLVGLRQAGAQSASSGGRAFVELGDGGGQGVDSERAASEAATVRARALSYRARATGTQSPMDIGLLTERSVSAVMSFSRSAFVATDRR